MFRKTKMLLEPCCASHLGFPFKFLTKLASAPFAGKGQGGGNLRPVRSAIPIFGKGLL
jgi:hypothetical protein